MVMIDLVPSALSHLMFLGQAEATPTPLPSPTPAATGLHEYAQIALHHPFTWGLGVGFVFVLLAEKGRLFRQHHAGAGGQVALEMH